MSLVQKAIEAGRCVVAVGAAQLKDPDVMLALKERAGMPALALSGPAQAPVQAIHELSVARLAGPGAVLVVCEPELADAPGVEKIIALCEKVGARPKVVVVARQYNPFQFPVLVKAKPEHEKNRTKSYLQGLPIPPAEAPAAAAEADVEKPVKAPKPAVPGEPAAPRFAFVGREDELVALAPMLAEGGPIVVSGPSGIGKTWLVEHAIAAAGLQRLPDVVLGFGAGFDVLIARLAEACRAAGSDGLAQALRGAHTAPELVNAAVAALGAAALDGHALVVHHLEFGLGREPDFFRRSRLELLLEALLCGTYGLRIVFASTRQPHFHREGQATHLRRLEVGGLKGRHYYDIFSAYKAPEFPRDRFGPISEKVHGHPIAVRAYAIAVRDRQDGLALTEDAKFLRAEGPADLESVGRQLAKKVEKLQGDERVALSRVAHCRMPVTGAMLSDMQISRKTRLELLADGLLDMVGSETDKRYRVHPLVREHLAWREITDFDVFAGLAELYGKAARTAEGSEKLALSQEANRCAFGARNPKLTVKVDYPDHDGVLEAAALAMRGEKPRYDVAESRVREVIARDASNSDAWLLLLEIQERTDAKPEAVVATVDEALAKAPVPELFQWATGYWLGRKQRPKAIHLLERAIEALPNEARLRTRLASLLLKQGRRPEGIAQLEQAMALEPMLPDSYGLLGQAKREEGVDSLPRAETLLREAVRLAPDDPTQVGRLADLLLAKARMAEASEGAAIREELKALLDPLTKGERKAPEAHLLLAQLVRQEGGDLDRAVWLLKRARKLSERHAGERMMRITLEEALIDGLKGNLDAAESTARESCAKNPGDHRPFGALGQVLTWRRSFVAAHAEFQRARERAPQGSLEAAEYATALAQLQTMIEVEAARLYAGEDAEALPSGPTASAGRVIRRRRDGADEPSDAAAESTDGITAPAEPAAEAPVTEATTEEAFAADPSEAPTEI